MKIGMIGAGNMGGAICAGLLKSGVRKTEICASDATAAAREHAQKTYGIRVTADNREAASGCDVLVLAVKPVYLPAVMEEIRDAIGRDTVVLSIVAGKTVGFLEEGLGADKRIVRAMPNLPALAGEGVTGYTCNANVRQADKKKVARVLASFSEAEEVPERLMDTVMGLSGCAPAYTALSIEALADGAVLAGMPRDMAYRFAAQTVKGSAELVLSGLHPAELKDRVCSPGGTTIEGVRVLEESAFRSAVMEAVIAGKEKAEEL